MDFYQLKKLIIKEANDSPKSFYDASESIRKKISKISLNELKRLIAEVGVIPEEIEHDSTEEKLFSKTTDIILARTFQELGLSASVNKERANCADVVAKSNIHGYSLIGDAKAFRLSRTAKNQKDFKVKSMIDWKGENDFAVLVCPYYQYPKSNSQIYGQALDHNVCLLSWEHLLLLLDKNIVETKDVNLYCIWNISDTLADSVTIKNKNKNTNYHETGNQMLCQSLGLSFSELNDLFLLCRKSITQRGESEIVYWEKQIEEIKKYTKEQAIEKLISALKLKEKISSINRYIDSLRG